MSKIEELEKTSAKRDFLITAMGPIVSFALGGIFLGGIILWEGKEAARISLPVFLIFSYLAAANFVLGISNLIPARRVNVFERPKASADEPLEKQASNPRLFLLFVI